MNVNELMVGDWIYYSNNPQRIKGAVDFTLVKDFEPIPLTSEILKKNGFEFKEDVEGFKYVVKEYVYSIDIEDYGMEYKVLNGEIIIHYVHELQHALKLCKLTTLADNFEI